MTELGDIRAQIAALAEQLGDEAAQAAHEAQMTALEEELARPADAVERALGAVEDLRAITVPAVMLAAAPEILVRGSDLDRAVLSVVREGVMTAEAVHVRGDAQASRALLEALRARPVRLEHPLVETEALRRRRATLVADTTDARVDRSTAAVMGWPAYVVAPVAVRSTVVAVLQADRPGHELGARDAGILWTFAAGLAQAYESATLRRTLRHERRQMRRLLTWLDARSSELADASIAFVAREEPSSLPQPEELDGPAPRPDRDRDASAVLDAVLTRREVEILRLLAGGLTNRAIAAELVISGGTVKFHVNSILRKLHVANRAEAVARYYALLDSRRG
jgi:DNA-binding CsgD family transcriptional regulator